MMIMMIAMIIMIVMMVILRIIQLLESPIPTTTPATLSQKASSGNNSGTKRGIIDLLMSKRPEKDSE